MDCLHDNVLEKGDDGAGVFATDDGTARDDHVGPCLRREVLISGEDLHSNKQTNNHSSTNRACNIAIGNPKLREGALCVNSDLVKYFIIHQHSRKMHSDRSAFMWYNILTSAHL